MEIFLYHIGIYGKKSMRFPNNYVILSTEGKADSSHLTLSHRIIYLRLGDRSTVDTFHKISNVDGGQVDG